MTTLDSSQWMYSSASGVYSHTIDQSLRFEDGDNPYLSKTLSGSSGTIFTFSCWVKLGNLSINRCLLQGYADGSNFAQIVLYSGNYIGMYSATSGTARLFAYTQALQRDASAWYNIVVKFNGTSSSEEFKIYVNGENQTLTTSTSLSAHQSNIGKNNAHYIGNNFNQSLDMDGYLAEVNFIDGTALDADSFGETKAGIWIPKDTSGLTFGTNGFRLKFQDSSALGDDTSGNSNDFTASGLAATDVVLDSPTNNWCTLNPLFTNGGTTQTFAEGNLKFTADSNYALANGTFAMRSGKWYWETLIQAQNVSNVGITKGTNANANAFVGYDPNGNVSGFGYQSTFIYGASGDGITSGTASASGQTSYTTGDIIGCSFDADAGELKFYKNNSLVYTISSINEHDWMPANSAYGTSNVNVVNFGQDSSFAGNKTAQGNTDDNGNGDFYYSPPSGFLALCAANLPNPGIDPAQDEEPADYFNTVLYTGNGSSYTDTQAISGVGFSPDWTWIKNRSASSAHILNDRVRGAGKNLFSSSTAEENTGGSTGDLFTSFDSDGFTVNYEYGGGSNNSSNGNGLSYVAWNWLAGGSASSNSNGSITSSVSANTEAGFSIVSYTGNGSAGATVGHGLASAPELFITKRRSQSDPWQTYVASLGATKRLELDATSAAITSTASFNDTEPNSSVFTLGSGGYGNASSATYIAYCFHSVDGYSKVGDTYTGNGSTDGTFVYTGFRPAWLMIKSYDQTRNWTIFDNKRTPLNLMDGHLHANSSVAEQTGSDEIDFLSNGFKFRSPDADSNYSNFNYIYLAFAEQPFKYSNAR